jgi:diguanylate cyclase (GGDEF)-like protein/PAS domain S-box-containing protein
VAWTLAVSFVLIPCLVFVFRLPPDVVAPLATFAAFLLVVGWAYDYGVYGGLIAPLVIFAYYATFVCLFDFWLVPLLQAIGMVAIQMVGGVYIGRLRMLGSRLRRGERRFRALTSDLNDTVLVVDKNGSATYASESYRKLCGFEPEALLGSGYRAMLDSRDEAQFRSAFLRALDASGEPERFEVTLHAADGSARVFDVCAANHIDDRAVGGIVFCGRDISSRKKAEALLKTQALHDALTGLPNRSHFLACLEQEIGQIRASSSVVVMFIDLNGFKEINDSFGHEAGDAFLRETARRISACVGNDLGVTARLGGDEFAVLLPGYTAADAVLVAKRMLKAIGKPLDVHGEARTIGASIGIAATTQPVDSMTLLRRADSLMYSAKRRRSNIQSEDGALAG